MMKKIRMIPQKAAEVKIPIMVKASSITLSGEENLIAKKALISQLTPECFQLILNHKDLVLPSAKYRLNLEFLHQKNLIMYIPSMEIDLEANVTNSQHLGRGVFKLNCQFFKEVPYYWRECLFELWPRHIH